MLERGAVTLGILAGGRGSRLGGRDKAWLARDGIPQVLRIAKRFDAECGAVLVSANRDLSRYAAHGLTAVADRIADAPFYRPGESSPEMQYLLERRTSLGGFVPRRVVNAPAIKPALGEVFDEFHLGTENRKASTTMVFVKMLAKLLRKHPWINYAGLIIVFYVALRMIWFGGADILEAYF